MISEEQIKAIFFKQFDMRHLKGRTWGPSDIALREGFKAAFTLLMPIIEKQNEALSELVHHCRDYALTEESFVIAMEVDKAIDTIQETKQMLNEIMGEKR